MGSAYFDAHSLWQQSEKPLYTTLNENRVADTCVVGAGIAGLTIAYLLCRSGQRVIVLDRERLGLGETGLTSAHLSNALDEGFVRLQRLHGSEGARLAVESHTAAIDLIEQICRQENIECDFKRVDGYLFLDPESEFEKIVRESRAAQESDMEGVQILPRAPTALFETGPCLHFPRQAQFHPLLYLNGLAEAVRRHGGLIFTHTEAQEIHGGDHAHVLTRQGFKVDCANIVVATNTPFNNRIAIHTKNTAYRSYIIGILVSPEKVSPSLFWDTASPYHYLRFAKDSSGNDLLLIGGEDHRTGHDSDPELHFEKLRSWCQTHLGLEARVVVRWSGQILEPVDGMAYIGRNPGDPPNVYIATGDSGHGLTHGTIAGLLIRDLIFDQANPWAELYKPSRLHMSSFATYLSEAAQSTLPYADWLTTGDVKDIQNIEPGEGAVVRDGFKKIAVYRDEMRRLHCMSAVCTHLGGVVRWNNAEKTWDCPCHGSRFDRFGQVVNGPAAKELSPVEDTTVSTEEYSIDGWTT